MPVAPRAYSDFAGQKIKTIHTTTPRGVNVTSGEFIDTISSNIEYYYCFRTIDKHDYFSIPSPIYRVQMVDNNGMIYPLIQVYDLPPPNIRGTEKTLRRYLQIAPALGQKIIIEDTEAVPASAGLASEPPSVTPPGDIWDSKTQFKVRLTGKDSGKKIDFNINFDLEPIVNPDPAAAQTQQDIQENIQDAIQNTVED